MSIEFSRGMQERHEERLTRRGRTSTISSGTKKISAFIFLAIEMASLAGITVQSASAPCNPKART